MLLAISFFRPPALAADESVGQVVLSRGAVSAVRANDSARLLGKGSEVFNGDRVTTAKKSFAVIEFVDDAKVTIRPSSELLIEAYSFADSGQDSSTLNLVKGGLRAITGRIGANNPDAYTVRTPLSVLGIRGTEYDARLCEQDCGEEEQKYRDIIPRTTKCPVKLEGAPAGFYATAYAGTIYLEKGGELLELGPGEIGFADADRLTCAQVLPEFFLQDPTPRPREATEERFMLECRP